jgi:hypothetical protein
LRATLPLLTRAMENSQETVNGIVTDSLNQA